MLPRNPAASGDDRHCRLPGGDQPHTNTYAIAHRRGDAPANGHKPPNADRIANAYSDEHADAYADGGVFPLGQS